MAQYKRFAEVYDLLMDDVPYDQWFENTVAVFKKYEVKTDSILELACGTGNMTNRFAGKGYRIVGTDISDDMLMIAQDKAYDKNLKVDYLYQDMTQINYKRKVDCVVSYCDGLNYIRSNDDLELVLEGVERILSEQGYFIFDISSHYKLSQVIGNNKFMESHEDVVYIWDNYYNEETECLDMELDIFMRCDEFEEEDMFERVHETHKQRAYKREGLKSVIEKKGFEVLEILDTNSLDEVVEITERELYICRKRR